MNNHNTVSIPHKNILLNLPVLDIPVPVLSRECNIYDTQFGRVRRE